jgi:hypothetical protein
MENDEKNGMIPKKEPAKLKPGEGTPIPKEDSPAAEFVTTNSGKKVFDMGESVVQKMNRERAIFDKDDFFQNLFENYLICVERNEPRERPSAKIITRWDMNTTFEDFMQDSLETTDQKIASIKFAKAANIQKAVHAIDDSVLADVKIDKGSAAAGKRFTSEDYDAVYEILRKSKEIIQDYIAGRLKMVVNEKTGRVRVTNSLI